MARWTWIGAVALTGCFLSHGGEELPGEPPLDDDPLPRLTVTLRTDLPGAAGSVEVPDLDFRRSFAVPASADPSEPFTVADLEGVRPDARRLVSLTLQVEEHSRSTREARVDNSRDATLTFVMTSSCDETVCPGGGPCAHGRCAGVCPGPRCECFGDEECPEVPDPRCEAVCEDLRCVTRCG